MLLLFLLRLLQRGGDHTIDRFGKHKFHGLPDLAGYIVEVFLVLIGQNHGSKSVSVSRQHFFLDAANRQNLTPKGDLARHPNLRVDLASCDQ